MKITQNLKWHLRVTILPQCNLRCIYCNPTGVFQKAILLDDEEILSIVKAAVACGITRVHWTGGEPCIRDVVSLFRKSRDLGIIQQIMTTNGSLRLDEIRAMKEAGLDRVNISLDSLDYKRNKEITGKDYFKTTIKWIKTSCETFDLATKMNVVSMSSNLKEIPDFIKFAQKFDGKLLLKFIELCPNNPAFYGDEIWRYLVSKQDIINELSIVGMLRLSNGLGDNPNAEYYLVGNTGVKVILITMLSYNFKCGLASCRKMRISPYGLVGSCIQQKGINLKGVLFEEKVEIIRKKMETRESYSDISPVSRQHMQEDYGIWRFGELTK